MDAAAKRTDTRGVGISSMRKSIYRGGSRIECRGVLSILRALARAKFYVLRPLLTSFPHTTCYTKKKQTNKIVAIII